MENSTYLIIFIILAFSLGAILVMKRNDIPEKLRRPMALVSLLLILSAFAMIVYAFGSMGK